MKDSMTVEYYGKAILYDYEAGEYISEDDPLYKQYVKYTREQRLKGLDRIPVNR